MSPTAVLKYSRIQEHVVLEAMNDLMRDPGDLSKALQLYA